MDWRRGDRGARTDMWQGIRPSVVRRIRSEYSSFDIKLKWFWEESLLSMIRVSSGIVKYVLSEMKKKS